jgi:hypothetical protein
VSTKSEKSPLRQKDIRTGAEQERKRIIALLKAEFGEEYYELGICGRIVALIKSEN